MKHLMFTHSSITSRICERVMDFEGLDPRDLIWICDRKATAPDDVSAYDWDSLHWVLPSKRINFIQTRMQLNTLLRKITKLCDGNKYSCYVPQTQNTILQVLTTHPLCERYFLIEEGTLSFTEQKIFDYKGYHSLARRVASWLYNYVNHGCYVSNTRRVLDNVDSKYAGCYTWHEEAFKGFEKRRLIPWPFVESCEFGSVKAVIVFDGVVEAGIVQSSDFSKALKDVFVIMKNRGLTNIAVKFHPVTGFVTNRPPVWWSNALEGMESDFQMTFLPRDVVVEDWALREGLVFITNISSVGLYVGLMGAEVWSMARLILKYDASYYKVLDKLPALWHEQVKDMNLES